MITTRTHEVFARALRLAEQLGHEDLTTAHIALELLTVGGVAVGVLHSHGVQLDVLRRELEAKLPPAVQPRPTADELSWTPGIEQFLEWAIPQARELGTEYFGCEHVLLALMRDSTSAPAQVLAKHGVGYDDAKSMILRSYTARPDA
jgi:ATP-dependent Clp protease ATP-binding subunit ClpC